MNRISLNEVHEKIIRALTDNKLLNSINSTEEKMQSLVLNKGFINKLSFLIGKDKINCRDIENLAIEILRAFADEAPKDWINYSFKFVLSKIYSEYEFIEYEYKYEKATLILLKLINTIMGAFYNELSSSIGDNINNCRDGEHKLDDKYDEFDSFYNDKYVFEFIMLYNEIQDRYEYDRMLEICRFSINIANQLREKGNNVDCGLIVNSLIIKYVAYCIEKNFENKEQKKEHIDDKYINSICMDNKLLLIYNICENCVVDRFREGHLPIETIIIMYASLRINNKASGKIEYSNKNTVYENIVKYCNDVISANYIFNILLDFEEFLVEKKVQIKFLSQKQVVVKDKSLLEGNEIVDYFKNVAINNNFKVMSTLYKDNEFNSFLELAKASNYRRDILAFLNIFKEFNLYLDDAKKLKLIEFLAGFVEHYDSEVKVVAAEILGKTLVGYKGDRLKLWKNYIAQGVEKYSVQANEEGLLFVQYFVKSFINEMDDNCKEYVDFLIDYAETCIADESKVTIILLSLVEVNSKIKNKEQANRLISIVIELFDLNKERASILGLYFIYIYKSYVYLNKDNFNKIICYVNDVNFDSRICINYLKYRISLDIERDIKIIGNYNEFLDSKRRRLSEIFLANLKTETYWIEKIINIDFLMDIVKNSNDTIILHTATHLCNLVKSSSRELVRSAAGKALDRVGGYLTMDQRNEISIELVKGIEVEGHKFSKYVPECLGRFALQLHTKELDECINNIKDIYLESNYETQSNALKSLSVMLEHYLQSTSDLDYGQLEHRDRLLIIISLIISGLVNESISVRMDTMFFLSKHIFNSNELSERDKYFVFKNCAKKIINLLDEKKKNYVHFLNDTTALDYMYIFIKSFRIDNGNLDIPVNDKVALYSDSFNPFLIYNKNYITELMNKGYDVYVYIDEFNCIEKDLPYKIRRKSVEIAIADQLNAFLFPENIVINLNSSNYMKKLRKIFLNKELHIFKDERVNKNSFRTSYIEENAYKYLKSIGLSKFEENRNKQIATDREYTVEIVDDFSEKLTDEIGKYVFMYTNLYENIGEKIAEKRIRLLIIKDTDNNNEIVGFTAFHEIGTAQLYGEFNDINVANYVRENTSGKITIIDGVYVNYSIANKTAVSQLLTETLLHNLRNDFTYAIYHNTLLNYESEEVLRLLTLHGFNKIDVGNTNKNIYVVDMKFPICLTLDLESKISNKYIERQCVAETIAKTRDKLRRQLTLLYPNSLVIALNSKNLQQVLVEKLLSIVKSNERRDNFEDYLCVPVGSFLSENILDKIPTKSLLVEKNYRKDLCDFSIAELPFQMSIEEQVEVILEFNKKILLVDDVMHKCFEISKVEELFKNKGAKIDQIVAGILSSNGKDIMETHGREVKYAYFIPNLQLWIRESMLYPFIGGNTVRSSEENNSYVIPSVNQILPYSTPEFLNENNRFQIYELSRVCLENSRDIYSVIEIEYNKNTDKKLSLKDLSEIMEIPRCPIMGQNIVYEYDGRITTFIENDLNDLVKLEKIFKE